MGFLIIVPIGLEAITQSFYFTATMEHLKQGGFLADDGAHLAPTPKDQITLTVDLDATSDPDLALIGAVAFELWERYHRFYLNWKDSGGEVTKDDIDVTNELAKIIEDHRGYLTLSPEQLLSLGQRAAAGLAWKVLESEGYRIETYEQPGEEGSAMAVLPRLRLVKA